MRQTGVTAAFAVLVALALAVTAFAQGTENPLQRSSETILRGTIIMGFARPLGATDAMVGEFRIELAADGREVVVLTTPQTVFEVSPDVPMRTQGGTGMTPANLQVGDEVLVTGNQTEATIRATRVVVASRGMSR